jgi:plasmid stabilization system protein ParE
MTSYKIIRHPDVDRDLFDILDLIAGYSGTETALRKLTEIEATVQAVAQTPHTGTIRDDIASGLRAIPAGRKSVVCFIVDDAAQEVRIVAIGYAGREWCLQIRSRNL